MSFDSLPYWGQLLIIALLCAGMGFVFYQYLYNPLLDELAYTNSSIDTIRADIRKYRPFRNKKDELEQEIAQINKDLALLERVFPSSKDDVEVKRFVESVANEFDVKLLSYRASAVIELENFKERRVRLEAVGRTVDFLRLFNALSRRNQVIHIYGLNMAQSRGSKKFPTMNYPVKSTFTISSYVYIPLPDEEGEEAIE